MSGAARRRPPRTPLLAPAIAGSGASGAGGRSSASACTDPVSPFSAQDLRYAREAHRLLSAKAATVWPGWRHMPPLLQRKGRCEYLIGHPSPPREFVRVASVNVLGRPLRVAPAGTITPGPVASTWKVGATWVAMVPARAEFQRALDRLLGRGAVQLGHTSYLRSLVHEAFHARQMTLTRGRPPSFGSTIDEQAAARLLAPLANAEARMAAEGRALAGAMTAPGLRRARTEVETFIRRREDRRARSADARTLAEFEQELEWTEGTARYADLRLVLLAGTGGYEPIRGIRYTPAPAYRQAFLRKLADRDERRDGLRGRWQDLGAAQGLVLDRLVSGWREAALPGRQSPEDLLRQALAVPAKLDDLRVARISLGGKQLQVALAERAEQWTRGLAGVSDLGALDGMLFALGQDDTAAFWMKGALIPLDIAFFDAGGKLIAVRTMPLCATNDCPTYASPRPYRFALEMPAGALQGLPAGARLVAPGLTG